MHGILQLHSWSQLNVRTSMREVMQFFPLLPAIWFYNCLWFHVCSSNGFTPFWGSKRISYCYYHDVIHTLWLFTIKLLFLLKSIWEMMVQCNVLSYSEGHMHSLVQLPIVYWGLELIIGFKFFAYIIYALKRTSMQSMPRGTCDYTFAKSCLRQYCYQLCNHTCQTGTLLSQLQHRMHYAETSRQ